MHNQFSSLRRFIKLTNVTRHQFKRRISLQKGKVTFQIEQCKFRTNMTFDLCANMTKVEQT